MLRIHNKLIFKLFLIVLLISTAGCASSIAKISVDGMRPIMEAMHHTTNKNQDVRLVKESMPTFMVQMDGFIEVSPENRFLLTQAAESCIGYAFLFVEDIEPERAKHLYLKGKNYALRVLEMNESFRQALEQDDLVVFRNALKGIHKKDTSALFFVINGWLSWIHLAHIDNPKALKDLPKVEAMMNRLLEMDDTYKFGGAHALYGVYYVSIPEMFGGNFAQAEVHFKEAFEISKSKYLLWDFLYARYYATARKDKALFIETLKRIMAAPDDLCPEEAFVNAAIKQKASDLLLKVNDYFL
ncbi:MAG: hypothetical protein C0403_04575 [Desulfobacterium sp.]|nr:hypothetical protein [Desulfobacterium sp.]